MKNPSSKATLVVALLLVTVLAASLGILVTRGENEDHEQATDSEIVVQQASPPESSTSGFPKVTPSNPTEQKILNLIACMSLDEKIDQLFMVGFNDQADAEYLIENYAPGGLILMVRNDTGKEALAHQNSRLQEVAARKHGIKLFIATDQEGGRVQRLTKGFADYKSARETAQLTDSASSVMRLNQELLTSGVNMNLSPVLDIDYGRNEIVGDRAFGTSSSEVVARGSSYLESANKTGIISVVKHFPGHGSTTSDSHKTLPTVEKTLEKLTAQDLRPFIEVISRGQPVVMVGSIAFPQIDTSGLPATLSSVIVDGVLRKQLGFDGVVLTDDAGMGALRQTISTDKVAQLAIVAGDDMILCVSEEKSTSCNRAQYLAMRKYLLDSVQSGLVSKDRIDESVRRILRLKQRFGLLGG